MIGPNHSGDLIPRDARIHRPGTAWFRESDGRCVRGSGPVDDDPSQRGSAAWSIATPTLMGGLLPHRLTSNTDPSTYKSNFLSALKERVSVEVGR